MDRATAFVERNDGQVLLWVVWGDPAKYGQPRASGEGDTLGAACVALRWRTVARRGEVLSDVEQASALSAVMAWARLQGRKAAADDVGNMIRGAAGRVLVDGHEGGLLQRLTSWVAAGGLRK